MSGQICETVRDRLVEFQGGALEALAAAETGAHLERCAECAAELTLLRDLAAKRRQAPAGFSDAVLAAVRAGGVAGAGRGARFRALPMAAAAAGVFLVGTVLVRAGFGPAADEPGEQAATEAVLAVAPWPGEDGLLAGAPVLDALSNAELEALLKELES
ncbi:MAG: hypothetical protein ABFS34_04505 [Gemmatimonadota bacterium]